MACSTCDDYQLIPGTDGILVDCPDYHACAPRAWCPVHSVRVDAVTLACPKCSAQARAGVARLLARCLHDQAVEAAA